MSNSKKPSLKTDSNNYWEQLERLEKLIRASELKAGVIFSFHGVILGLFFDRFEQIQPVFDKGIVFIILILIWFFCVLVSIFFCFKCFRPQIELKYEKNVLFYRDAVYAFGKVEDFSKELIKVYENEKKLFQLLSEQIHAESKIIDQKFKSVQNAIRFFAISFIFVVITASIYIIATYI
ncbi:Pycsar system effector family protein [uncultured Croceitalea sp.]|uniref:Pycsar system effector family protein n=1 Tax=uncultured Croceitalea sp. TaxID=1798908 RepID=UPI00374F2BAE